MDERKRYAVEMIVGDMSLTEDLDDPEASRLLEWGATLATRIAENTVDTEEFSGDELLDIHLQSLRRVMRRIDKLASVVSDAEPDEIEERLHGILEIAEQVPGLRTNPLAGLADVALLLENADVHQMVETVLGYLSGEEDAET